MKIYEKPMATIEMLNVEDVITASVYEADKTENADAYNALAGAASTNTDNVIIFEW